jgi:hypothetical protein
VPARARRSRNRNPSRLPSNSICGEDGGHRDKQRLCWLLAATGWWDLSEVAAVIETWTGARQAYLRKPIKLGRVLAWKLADAERH